MYNSTLNGTEYSTNGTNSTEDPWVINRLLEPFNAIAIRVIPITYNNTDDNSTAIPVVRFELMGCQRDVFLKSTQGKYQDILLTISAIQWWILE